MCVCENIKCMGRLLDPISGVITCNEGWSVEHLSSKKHITCIENFYIGQTLFIIHIY